MPSISLLREYDITKTAAQKKTIYQKKTI